MATPFEIIGLGLSIFSTIVDIKRQDIQFGLEADIAGLSAKSIRQKKALAQFEFASFEKSSEQQEAFLRETTTLKTSAIETQEKLLELQNLSFEIGEASEKGDISTQLAKERERSTLVLEQQKISGAGRGRSSFLNTYSTLALTTTFSPSQKLAALEQSGVIREQAFLEQKDLIQNALAQLDAQFEFQLQQIFIERELAAERFKVGQTIFDIEADAAAKREKAAKDQQDVPKDILTSIIDAGKKIVDPFDLF